MEAEMKKGPGRNARSGKRNPPGTKIAASFAKARKGDVYHTGELTEANNERAGRKPDWPQS